jgi:RNA-splicing ligase RtcB
MSLAFTGKYTDCIVHTNEIEEEATAQIYGFLNHSVFEGATIRIMPDVHSGKDAVIGFTSTLGEKIIPNVIGVDIACGVLCVELGDIEIDFPVLDAFIRKEIPSGCCIRDKMVSRYLLDKSYAKVRN